MSEDKKSYEEQNKEVILKIDKNLMEGKRNGLECLEEIKNLTELVSSKGNPKKVLTILFPIIESMDLEILQTIIPNLGGGPVIDTEVATQKKGDYATIRDRDLIEDAQDEDELSEGEKEKLVVKLEQTMDQEDKRLVSLFESSVDPGQLPKSLRTNKIAIFQAGLGMTASIVTLGLAGYFGLGPKDEESIKGLVGKTGVASIVGASGAAVTLVGGIAVPAAAIAAAVMAAYILLPKMRRLITHFWKKGKRKGEIYEWFEEEMSQGKEKDEQKYTEEYNAFIDTYVNRITHIQMGIDTKTGRSMIAPKSESIEEDLSEFLTEESISKFNENNKKWKNEQKEKIQKDVKEPKGPIRKLVAGFMGLSGAATTGYSVAILVPALGLPTFMMTWPIAAVIAAGVGLTGFAGSKLRAPPRSYFKRSTKRRMGKMEKRKYGSNN